MADQSETPKLSAPSTDSVDEMNTGRMVFELKETVGELKTTVGELKGSVRELKDSMGELKGVVESLARTVEYGVRRTDALERSSGDIKDVLRLLAPKLDDVAGFIRHRAPSLADKADLQALESRLDDVAGFIRYRAPSLADKADLQAVESKLFLEIRSRPTRRQAVFDMAWIVGIITAARLGR